MQTGLFIFEFNLFSVLGFETIFLNSGALINVFVTLDYPSLSPFETFLDKIEISYTPYI